MWHLWDNQPAIKQPQTGAWVRGAKTLARFYKLDPTSSHLSPISPQLWGGKGKTAASRLSLPENNHNLSLWPLSQVQADINLCSFAMRLPATHKSPTEEAPEVIFRGLSRPVSGYRRCVSSLWRCCMCHQLAARWLPNYNINNANWRHFHSVCFVGTREATKRYRHWCLFSGRSSDVIERKKRDLFTPGGSRSLTHSPLVCLQQVEGTWEETRRREEIRMSGTQEVFWHLCAQLTLQNFNYKRHKLSTHIVLEMYFLTLTIFFPVTLKSD